MISPNPIEGNIPLFPLKVIVLISGNGSNLQAIMDSPLLNGIEDITETAKKNSSHEAKNNTSLKTNLENSSPLIKLCCVISNEENAYGIERAKARSIPTHVIPHKAYNKRSDFETALINTINTYQPDLIVLAGFMRILSQDFVLHYPNKILNIHPSLLPRHPGLNTHEKVLANKETEHGVSVHFVTDKLDGGPIIAWGKINVESNDTSQSLAQKIHHIEYQLYPKVIGWYAKGRLQCRDDVIYLDNVALPQEGIEGVQNIE